MSERNTKHADDVAQDLATEVHGRGVAVSLDATEDGTAARVWNVKGTEVVREVSRPTKSAARDSLIAELRAVLRVT